MLEIGGFCVGLIAGWVLPIAGGVKRRCVIAIALWTAGAAVLLRIHPALSLVPLAAGVGVGAVARTTLQGWAIRGRQR